MGLSSGSADSAGMPRREKGDTIYSAEERIVGGRAHPIPDRIWFTHKFDPGRSPDLADREFHLRLCRSHVPVGGRGRSHVERLTGSSARAGSLARAQVQDDPIWVW